MTPQTQMRLYQLASQALPIGGFSHSHGLEAAIEAGVVRDAATLQGWIDDLLRFPLGSYEAPLLADLCAAWADRDGGRIAALNAEFLATRESAELRAATVQMGYSLRELVVRLAAGDAPLPRMLQAVDEPSLPCAWSCATAWWDIPVREALPAYLWSWAENQVLVAVKTIPLGQTAGQRVLMLAGDAIAALAARLCDRCGPDPAGRSNFAPALAIHSSRHETQYSRLFRS